MQETQIETEQQCFQLKGSLLPMTVMEVLSYDYHAFNSRLSKLVKQAPSFFKQMPIIVSLEKLPITHEPIDFIELAQLCEAYGIQPIAIKGGNDDQKLSAMVAGLPRLPSQIHPKMKELNEAYAQKMKGNAAQEQAQPKEKIIAHEEPPVITEKVSEEPSQAITEASFVPSKIIRHPVRSGQQIYAKGGDLIILSSVSTGAEVLADGNIHVYGPLRGRALAGVKGNTDACIFCMKLEAELISIAGRYKIDDDVKKSFWQQSVRISLVGNQLNVEPLPV